MQGPRRSRRRPPSPPGTSDNLPSLTYLSLDDNEPFDPAWRPAAKPSPRSWRRLLPLGVTASMVAVASIVLVVLAVLSQQKDLEGTDDVMLPARVAEQVPGTGSLVTAVTPTAIPAATPLPPVAHAAPPTPEVVIRRGGDNQHVPPVAAPAGVTQPPRLDDPVLFWLPEILAASEATGVPASLIAGVIKVESDGDRDAVSPHGARGLMQVMPVHLVNQGVPEPQWNDPATNILAGSRLLQWHIEVHGTHWEGVARYFGIGCDGFNCTDAYVNLVLAAQARFVPLIADPYGSGLALPPQ